MPVTSPDLQIALSIQNSCAGLTLTDNTGTSPTAPSGYGLAGGPAVNDVDTVTITNTYNRLGTTIVYVFTVTNGVITAATISIGGGTPVSIFDALVSTVWPFTTGFDMTADYGVTLPDFTDDVVLSEYTIEGDVAAVDFEFSTTASITIDCNTTCCRDKKFIDLPLDCKDPAAVVKALYIDSLLLQSAYSAAYGYVDRAIAALARAEQICDDSCGCGC